MEYQKYEFCKAINCCSFKNKCFNINCIRTAKEFHKWLVANGFKIVKQTSTKKNRRERS